MTEDLSFEKGLMLIGEPRSGKSTLTKLAKELVGGKAYVSLDTATWVAKDTSRETLIGRRLGVFEDMRLKPGKWWGKDVYDPGGLDHVSVELMLKLTSGNPVTLARKYIPDWTGVVPIHLWIVSNVVPVLNDPVLPTRFIKLAFGESFVGKEDVTVKDRLAGELPGIAQKALRAYRDAKARGRLLQPDAGLALKAEIEEQADPFVAWFNSQMVVDGNATVKCGVVFAKFVEWCEGTGNRALLRAIPDGSKLTKALKGKIGALKALQTTSNHPREYLGLRLRTKAERSA